MFFIYNILQITVTILFSPVLLLIAVVFPKYRGNILDRLGVGFTDLARQLPVARTRIWIHALSVGEVSSAQALIKGIRRNWPQATLLFSSTTKTGAAMAKKSLDTIDYFVPFPFDNYWLVRRFIRRLKPDLFILIETDFWPNFLMVLQQERIPSLLVNGRISSKSAGIYHQFRWFFTPVFSAFSALAMQTDTDVARMIELGVSNDKVKKVGNLKYDSLPAIDGQYDTDKGRQRFGIPAGALVWIAGSTHEGEERIILSAFMKVRRDFHDLMLIIAPRQISRADDIAALAGEYNFLGVKQKDCLGRVFDVLVIDTMGDLLDLYAISDVAFVGGSLIPAGGHNPLEPAAFGKPVLFGPFMDDFSEICQDMKAIDPGCLVHDADELSATVHELLTRPAVRLTRGNQLKSLIGPQQGVTDKIITLIKETIAIP